MAYPPSDPRGYYRILGLRPGADTTAIKAAYRRRAKELHPDRNPRPNAQDDFQRLTEAYHTLSDPERRAAYDSGRTAAATVETEPYRPQVCRGCGKIPAQPRYIVFPTVRGRLVRSVVDSTEGVFCRRCADAAGLRAALSTWLLGWWSLPRGPFDTVRALAVNLRGGHFPRDANHRLLLRQARAFLLRGDDDLAYALALQARRFATTEDQHRQIGGLLAALPPGHRRPLRDRWRGPSVPRVAQLGPFAGLGALGLTAMALWTDVNLWGMADRRPPAIRTSGVPGLQRPILLRTGQLYEVTVPALPVRIGPGATFRMVSELEAGTVVLVTENAPVDGWVRIITANGVSGYVAGRYLTPGLSSRAFDESIVRD